MHLVARLLQPRPPRQARPRARVVGAGRGRADRAPARAQGCDVCLLPLVGGGLYAGRHRAQLRGEYLGMVNEVLRELVKEVPRGCYALRRVVLVTLE